MTGLADHHSHLMPDDDALGPATWSVEHLAPYVEAARARGVEALAVTEHVYRFAEIDAVLPDPAALPGPYWDTQPKSALADYRAGIEEAIAAGLPLLLGLELDWIAEAEAGLRALADGYRWDVVLGSVHFVEGGAVDDPRWWVWDVVDDPAEVYARYYRALRASARSGIYDVITHPDLVKYFGHRLTGPALDALHEETAVAFAEAGVCVEINTAGLRKPVGELYPQLSFLRRCREAGVPLSLGSDAHVAADAARDFDLAVAHARAAGYTTVTRFRGRDRRQVPLG